jgi:hypothetical protein
MYNARKYNKYNDNNRTIDFIIKNRNVEIFFGMDAIKKIIGMIIFLS